MNRNTWLWAIQVSVAIISLSETLLLTYLGYKVRSVGHRVCLVGYVQGTFRGVQGTLCAVQGSFGGVQGMCSEVQGVWWGTRYVLLSTRSVWRGQGTFGGLQGRFGWAQSRCTWVQGVFGGYKISLVQSNLKGQFGGTRWVWWGERACSVSHNIGLVGYKGTRFGVTRYFGGNALQAARCCGVQFVPCVKARFFQ